MATKNTAIVATNIGAGAKLHIVEATIDGDKFYQQEVSCGSSRRSGWVRSAQHGNYVLTKTVEIQDTEAAFKSKETIDWKPIQIAKLALYIDALVALEEIGEANVCNKCVKSVKRRIAFFKKEVAA